MLLLLASGAEEATEEEKRTKMQACIDLTRVKLETDAEAIEEFISNALLNRKQAEEKITATILLACFNKIPLEVAVEFIESGGEITAEVLPYLEYDKSILKAKPEDL